MSNNTFQVSCKRPRITLSSDPLYIIVEFLSKGNLKDLLKDSRSKGGRVYGNLHGASQSLSSKDLVKFAKDVADGMAFIANHKVCVTSSCRHFRNEWRTWTQQSAAVNDRIPFHFFGLCYLSDIHSCSSPLSFPRRIKSCGIRLDSTSNWNVLHLTSLF